MIYRLDKKRLVFPNPRLGDSDGLFAVGGDLSTDRLLLAYSNGIFPWYSFRDCREIHWYCPMNRFVIFPNEIHVSHSMRTFLNQHAEQYTCTIDNDFDGVINNCSQLRYNEQGAWLGKDMIEAYTRLHQQGFAHSVEVWDEHTDQLVGGLYGVAIGASFFGESMFSLVPNGSKIALIHLARFMQQNGGKLIDCQFETPHLKSMGGRHISYDEYMKIVSSDY
ncbi:leucyl/phenylalanyl-tRNA--protein transferase [Prevotella sp.]|uniref:leucyl/phenylalanyl-tRNA--protein transferase n=1 Tax=Prevotella sp. TaxID=59823 RepID=UPI002E762D17|nr:leucyl/phenylalanyl-tRNA--protein transferase [Prevotella sp.]MEE0669789.1 leucyl/phenylalanyl-tRNA--protein transferase [Prevotella sp.]